MSRRKEPTIPNELLDQLLAGGAASAAFEQGGLLDELKKALTERALNAEMDHHLAGEDGAGKASANPDQVFASFLLHQAGPSAGELLDHRRRGAGVLARLHRRERAAARDRHRQQQLVGEVRSGKGVAGQVKSDTQSLFGAGARNWRLT